MENPIAMPTSPESEESYCTYLATNLSKRHLMDGTASSQEIVFWLKYGSEQSRLERERLEEENKLLRAKTAALENDAKNQVNYAEVLNALKGYRGEGNAEPE